MQTNDPSKYNPLQPKKDPYRMLRPLWFGVFSDIIGFSLLVTVIPSLVEEFNLTPFIISFIPAVNGLFSFLSAPVWGTLSDKHGRKPMLLLAQSGTLLGFIILAFSPNYWWILISRIIDGIFGGNFPIAKAVLNDVVEPREMNKQMTNVGVAHNIANLFGPALGGILFTQFGIIGPGLIAAATSIFTFIITYIQLEETAPVRLKENVKDVEILLHDQPSYKIERSESDSSNPKSPIDPTNPLNNPTDWKQNRPLLRALVIFGFSAIGFMLLVSNLSMYAFLKLGINAQIMGIVLSIAGVFQITIRYTIYIPLLNKWGDYRMVRMGFSLYLVSFFLLAWVQSIAQLIGVLLINSFATSSTRGGMSSFISNLAHPKQRGKVQGISSSLDTFGQIVGPLIGGLILTYLSLPYFPVISWIMMLIALILLITGKELQEKVHITR